MPAPTGTLDQQTIDAIWGFQRQHAPNLLAVDGKIHRGSYHNRVIKDVWEPLLTIMLLNLMAREGAVRLHGTRDVMVAPRRVAPQLELKRVVFASPVGP